MTSAAARFADPSTFPSVFDEPAAQPGAQVADLAGPEATTATVGSVAVGSNADPVVDLADPVVDIADPVVDIADFAGLGVPRPLVRALAAGGITAPFPIQSATIPDALAGRDVLGRGQTGSGKTLAFGLPILARLSGDRSAPGRPRALILVPTRELAMQVSDALTPLGRATGLFTRTAVGGVSYDKQIRDLRRGVDVLVATPGRLGDLIERGECALDGIEVTVLDEADQMADMGFLPDVTALLEQTPAGSQRLLFSATLDGDVDTLVRTFLHEPVLHEVDPPRATVSTMEHHLLLIPPTDKLGVVSRIAARRGRTIMFVRTQLAVDRLAGQLAQVGVRAGALHGGKTQAVRTRTLAEFREGRTSVLVATDVAARGIHVDGVSLVVHVDPPKDPKDYLHRAGRTARAGESGSVVTLVLPRQRAGAFALLEKAGVTASRTQVRSDAPELVELTGAREPSGVPVPPDEPAPPRRRSGPTGHHPFADRPRGHGGRPREDRRHGAGRPWHRTDRPANG